MTPHPPIRRSRPPLRPAAYALALVFAGPADAARPLITDDARFVDGGSCQVESWVRKNENSTEYWAIPACNPFGFAELSVGGSKTNAQGETHTANFLVQAKTIFRKLEPNGWGIGAAVGYLDPKADPDRRGGPNFYGYVPTSVSFGSDFFVLHTNIGALRAEGEKKHRVTWGVGSETRLHPSLFLVAEVYRQEAAGPHYQAGLRYWAIPDRLQFDVTVGDRVHDRSDSRWFSIGVRWLSGRLSK